MISQLDREFREALILSDLCTADGMPIIWIAWLIGIPIKKREIMMFIDEIERLRAVSRPPMTTCVISCEATRFGHALLRSHAVKAVRDVLAENTKIDP